MYRVFVLDTNKQPLSPCHPAVARMLLKTGKAGVFRRFPFTLILKRAVCNPQLQTLRLKIDPGSKITGLAIINDARQEVLFAAEIHHRGERIKSAMLTRRALRRERRNRKTRYRQPRFLNRTRSKGWLPPSLISRVENIQTWVNRLCHLCPITTISMELVKFDTQKLQNPEISGVEYQQGKLYGYEVREYLLEKFRRRCAYCKAENVRIEIEHIVPKIRGGTDRVSNLTIACHECNQRKGNMTAKEFGFPEVQKLAQSPLKDAGALNAIRWELYNRLHSIGLSIEVGTGGHTKFNRTRLGLPKAHWIDAACVGASTPEKLNISNVRVLSIRAMGHGKRQRCRTDKYGFPICHAPRVKYFLGFRTGDMIKAVIPRGKYAGKHTGRIVIRFKPSFKLNSFGVHPKYLRKIQMADGYYYTLN